MFTITSPVSFFLFFSGRESIAMATTMRNALFQQSLINVLNHAKQIAGGEEAAKTKLLVVGGFAIHQILNKRALKDIDLWVCGDLAPPNNAESSLRQYLLGLKSFERKKKKPFERRKGSKRGWRDIDGHLNIPYDYTQFDMEHNPRSRIISTINERNIPFADRDYLLWIKAISCLRRGERKNGEGERKDAGDFIDLAETRGPLSFPGWQPKKAESMKKDVVAHLDHLCSVKGESKQRLMDLLEL